MAPTDAPKVAQRDIGHALHAGIGARMTRRTQAQVAQKANEKRIAIQRLGVLDPAGRLQREGKTPPALALVPEFRARDLPARLPPGVRQVPLEEQG